MNKTTWFAQFFVIIFLCGTWFNIYSSEDWNTVYSLLSNKNFRNKIEQYENEIYQVFDSQDAQNELKQKFPHSHVTQLQKPTIRISRIINSKNFFSAFPVITDQPKQLAQNKLKIQETLKKQAHENAQFLSHYFANPTYLQPQLTGLQLRLFQNKVLITIDIATAIYKYPSSTVTQTPILEICKDLGIDTSFLDQKQKFPVSLIFLAGGVVGFYIAYLLFKFKKIPLEQ